MGPRKIDLLQLVTEIAVAYEEKKKVNWDTIATKVGSKSGPTARAAWSDHRKRFKGQQGEDLDENLASQVDPKAKKTAPKRKRLKKEMEDETEQSGDEDLFDAEADAEPIESKVAKKRKVAKDTKKATGGEGVGVWEEDVFTDH